LGVSGTVTASTFTSNVATGTAPLTVSSTTLVSNLNVDYLEGQHGSYYLDWTNTTNKPDPVVTVTLSGDVTGTANATLTDVTSNTITITTTIAANSVALGTDTTGDYVANLTAGTSITLSGQTGEGANITVNHADTSTLSGLYGGSGVSSITVDGLGHITAIGTATYLTAESDTLATVTARGNSTGTAVSFTNATAASSRTTGAVVVTGGLGVGANSYFTNLNVASNIAYVAPNGANTITSQMLNGGTLAWSGNAGQLFSITDSMTGNIFSVNDVSGIPMISVDAGGNIQFASSGGFVAYGVSPAVSAAGTTQGTATALTRPINIVSTVAAGSADGVVMPATVAGMRIIVINTSAATLKVYPASGGQINALGTNAAYVLAAGGRLEFVATTTSQWYTLNATYA